MKANKKIRLKSTDSIKLGAAKSAEIRVGSMLVGLTSTSSADIVIGHVDTSGVNLAGVLKINAS